MKRILPLIGILAAIALVGFAGYWLGSRSSTVAAAAPQKTPGSVPIAVEGATVALASLPQGIAAVGSLRSDEAVVLRPEVAGRISEILFREGQRVGKGDMLVRFDNSVLLAELAQAKANLELSKSKFERAVDLQKKNFISSQARDEAENNYRVSQASVELAAAKLSKLELRAPFSGIVGLRTVSVGDYVKDGQDMVNLEGVDPLKVDFRVPEIYLRQVAAGQSLQVSLDAFPNRFFQGKVYAINPLVDVNGRSIVIRALVGNSDARLRPGMFARVRLLFSEKHDSLVIPEQALMPVGDDQYVYRIVEGRALRVRVAVGQRNNARVEILDGLQAGDMVVTAGQNKIRDGAHVSLSGTNTEAATGNPPSPAAAAKS
jgi:membrane fusion protein (multidrug efflux system)